MSKETVVAEDLSEWFPPEMVEYFSDLHRRSEAYEVRADPDPEVSLDTRSNPARSLRSPLAASLAGLVGGAIGSAPVEEKILDPEAVQPYPAPVVDVIDKTPELEWAERFQNEDTLAWVLSDPKRIAVVRHLLGEQRADLSDLLQITGQDEATMIAMVNRMRQIGVLERSTSVLSLDVDGKLIAEHFEDNLLDSIHDKGRGSWGR